MKITEALKSLENSWSKEEVLLKIKNGEDLEKIVNEFFNLKLNEIETLTNFINPEDKVLLRELEDLSTCEAKLIKKINNYKLNTNNLTSIERPKKKISNPEQKKSFKLGLFMLKWSNKFIFISLLAISAIALTKQAWA